MYLKDRHRCEREHHSEGLALRIHRALSWLNRSEQADDDDGKFIFLWIAFNSAYSQSIDADEHTREYIAFGKFLEKLISLDEKEILFNLVWKEYSSSIRLLLNNQFLFKPFWDFKAGHISEKEWKAKFDASNFSANKALGKHQTDDVLRIVLSRMYMLRNQLVHGGATYNSSVNREQLKSCTSFLGKLVPFVIELMLDNPKAVWGDALYPPIEH